MVTVYRGTLAEPIVFPESVIITDENLDSIDFEKVIYCEVSPMGAMGNEGGILIYVLSDEDNLVTYETNVSIDQQSCDAVSERIDKNVNLLVYYNGGLGNYVYIKKNAQLEIDEKYGCFWYHSKNSKLRIDSSVPGVYRFVAGQMGSQDSGNIIKKGHMKQFNLGKTEKDEDVELDFEKEGIRFIELIGGTGSGKSVFHEHIYHDLMARYTPEERGFIFMDMTRVDFIDWNPEYLVMPTIVDQVEAVSVLETLKDEERTIIVHIEECDMVVNCQAQFERGLDNVLYNNKNIILIYSTSNVDIEDRLDRHKKFVDMRVVFQVTYKEDSLRLLGNEVASSFMNPGERILAFNGKQIKCVPFPEEEVQGLG